MVTMIALKRKGYQVNKFVITDCPGTSADASGDKFVIMTTFPFNIEYCRYCNDQWRREFLAASWTNVATH